MEGYFWKYVAAVASRSPSPLPETPKKQNLLDTR